MENFNLVGTIMAFEDGTLTEEEVVEFFQHLVDTGIAWDLQGSYGRTATRLIQEGKVVRK